MAVNREQYNSISAFLRERNVNLVAVSKTKPIADILALYGLGQRDFGENYVQELVQKQSQLPPDIRWHFIGHLQTNKVKQIAPFVHLIHGVDSERLLFEINKQGAKFNRVINCLLQVYIAKEESKFGMDETELSSIQPANYPHARIRGLMGMASFTLDQKIIRTEFNFLRLLFEKLKILPGFEADTLSMGMSADYEMAIEEGSNLVRIGSLIFGDRQSTQPAN